MTFVHHTIAPPSAFRESDGIGDSRKSLAANRMARFYRSKYPRPSSDSARREDLLFPLRDRLFIDNRLARCAVDGLKAEHVLVSECSDRSFDCCRRVRALAYLARYVLRQPGV